MSVFGGVTQPLLGLFSCIQAPCSHKLLSLSNCSSSRPDSSLLLLPTLEPPATGDGANVPHYCRRAVVCKLNCEEHSLPHHKKSQWQPHCDLLFSPLCIWSPACATVMIMQIRPVSSRHATKFLSIYRFGNLYFCLSCRCRVQIKVFSFLRKSDVFPKERTLWVVRIHPEKKPFGEVLKGVVRRHQATSVFMLMFSLCHAGLLLYDFFLHLFFPLPDQGGQTPYYHVLKVSPMRLSCGVRCVEGESVSYNRLQKRVQYLRVWGKPTTSESWLGIVMWKGM